MKKIFLLGLVLAMATMSNVFSQTLKISLQQISGKERSLTLKFKPGNVLMIGTLYSETDLLKAAYYYDGKFIGASNDSITLKLREFTDEEKYTDGMKFTKVFTAKSYAAINGTGSEEVKIAYANIHSIKTDQKSKVWGSVGIPLIFISFGAFLISPAICYNYGENTFNTNLYKNIGLCCSLAAFTGLTVAFLTPSETYNLKAGWPNENKKSWRIKSIKPLGGMNR